MKIEITSTRLSGHEHIVSYRWRNPSDCSVGASDKPTMAVWVDQPENPPMLAAEPVAPRLASFARIRSALPAHLRHIEAVLRDRLNHRSSPLQVAHKAPSPLGAPHLVPPMNDPTRRPPARSRRCACYCRNTRLVRAAYASHV